MPATSKGPSSDNKKVFDVAKPGATPPSATSRPTIVGHRSMAQDPMVSPAVSATPAAQQVPPSEVLAAEAARPEPTTAPPLKEAAPGARALKPLSAAERTTSEIGISSESGSGEKPKPPSARKVDSLFGAAPSANASLGAKSLPETAEQGPLPPNESLEAAASRDMEHIEELIERRSYFVPIGQVYHASGTLGAFFTGLLLGLIILAAIIALLDSGLVDAGFELPFDFIKEL